MGVQGRSQAIVQVVCGGALPAAEVQGLGHAAGGQDADQLIEVGVAGADSLVQGVRQGLQTSSQCPQSTAMYLSRSTTASGEFLLSEGEEQADGHRWR